MKNFENSLASGGLRPPDPLRGVLFFREIYIFSLKKLQNFQNSFVLGGGAQPPDPPKVFPLYQNPGGAPGNENFFNNFAIFQQKVYFSLKKLQNFLNSFVLVGCRTRTPCKSPLFRKPWQRTK